jgi:peroxiredoxin
MSRIAAIVTVLVLSGVVGWLGLEANRVTADRQNARTARAVLPSLELVDLEDRPAAVEAAYDRSTVLVFLTTICEFCKSQVAAMRRNASAFARVDVLFISPEQSQPVRELRREYDLDQFPQFQVLRDTVPTLARMLHIRRVPTVLVYDPAGRLNEEFEGLTSIERILDAVEVTR